MEYEVKFSPEAIGNCPDIEGAIRNKLPRSVRQFHITKSFIDARHKGSVKIIYRVSTDTPEDSKKIALPFKENKFKVDSRPVIIGFGPSGMFAGLVLASYGLNPIILERGEDATARTQTVKNAMETGVINPDSNIMFGEGGAGTFSDGKLYSGISSSYKAFINDVFISCGASSDIAYEAHPHVGSDILPTVVEGVRKRIESLGGEVRFGKCVKEIITSGGCVTAVKGEDFEIACSKLIICAGHGSKDFYEGLIRAGLTVQPKPFSIGVRIEHLRRDVDMCQYGFDTSGFKNISAANYKLAVESNTGKKLYTFCMCPGGTVLSASAIAGRICTNGMSLRARDTENSNSALLVPVAADINAEDPLYLFDMRDDLERKAFVLGDASGRAPAITVGDYLAGKRLSGFGKVTPSFKPGVTNADISELFDESTNATLRDGIGLMGKKASFFNEPDAVLTAAEAGSSSPVRVLRDSETLESVSIKGIYPSGEGCGYAGGIMSCACDGIKCANRLAQSMLL